MNGIVVLVWYRVDPARSDECRRLCGLLHDRVAARFSVSGRFGWRDEPARNRRTWLESWEPLDEASAPGFLEALDCEARSVGLDAIALDGRYVDVFRWVHDDSPQLAGSGQA